MGSLFKTKTPPPLSPTPEEAFEQGDKEIARLDALKDGYTWIRAIKVAGNHSVKATQLSEMRDGEVWVKCRVIG